MRKLTYLVAVSLDGCIAAADGSFDCFPAEGDHVADYLRALDSFDTVLMGRRTYEVALRRGVTDPYPRMRSYVFSRSMRESPDARVQLVSGDAAAFVAGLNNQPGGDIYLCGGAELAAALLAAHLIDEIVVKLNPLLIGSGIPLFARIHKPAALELIGSKTYPSGVVMLSYRVSQRPC
jgi:dihydrofolate reductase